MQNFGVKGRDHLEDIGVDGGNIKMGLREVWLGVWLSMGLVASSCEHHNELLVLINSKEVID
jgi:hypothetical protein